MAALISVLVVDDDRYDNDRYCQLLRGVGYAVSSALDAEEGLRVIERKRFDVVLLDMLLPLRLAGRLDFGGLELLRRIKQADTATQVIAVTGYGSRELAADAMREGAFDYITKDPDTEERLPVSVRVAAARAASLRAVAQHRPSDEADPPVPLPRNLIADSAAMRQAIRRAQSLAGINSPLLITGEPGVGKELIAQVVHLNSRYAAGRFIVVPCRSLNRDMAELWGSASEPGSGYCAEAQGGTLLLKGVHELPYAQQRQIADFLQEGRFRPVGGGAPVDCDLRVMATTSADLERLVRIGRFWRDLYDQLAVASLHVPPLRERRDKDDILAIAGYLLHHYGLAESIHPAAAAQLMGYDYPQGNVKELESILREAALQAGGGVIRAEHLPALAPAGPETSGRAAARGDGEAAQIELSVRFIPGSPATLIWESDIGGSTHSSLTLPYAEADIALVYRALEAAQWRGYAHGPTVDGDERDRLSRLGLWADDGPAPDLARIVGQHLYEAIVLDPKARSALDSARQVAARDRRQLNIVLRFPPEAATLAGLPWELLWGERQPVLLSHNRLASCIRYLEIAQALVPPPPLNQQLRLLVIIPTRGVSDELYREERRLREAALRTLIDDGRVVVEELRPARISDLTDRLLDGPPVDVLHFYGHGAYQGGSVRLQLDDGALNASQLASVVGDIPLVVLYACRSGEVGRGNIFTGIAPMLSAEGVRTVVAMQYSVPVVAANRFHTFLYRSLARGESVQVAVARARQALFVEFPDSWYVPVVYIRSREVSPVVLVRA